MWEFLCLEIEIFQWVSINVYPLKKLLESIFSQYLGAWNRHK